MRSRSAAALSAFLLALTLAAAVGVAQAQALSFGHTVYATGNLPSGVAVADVNKDGMPDLVTANYGYGNGVSVLLGVGGGAFGAKTDFASGTAPLAIAVGDFNKDGDPDLVTANYGVDEAWVGSVSVLLGDGAGSFAAKTDFAAGTGSCSVAVGDFNGDGNPDLVTANGAEGSAADDVPGNSVSVLLGNGAGGFSANTDFATGAYPKQVLVADLNKDGKQDLVTANRGTWDTPGSTVSVLLGDGAGGFAAKTDFTTGALPGSVAVGDLNKDAKPDLVTANGAGTVSVLLGNGAGGFAPKADFPMGSSSFSPGSPVIVDLDNDGKADVATTNNQRTTYPFYVEDYSGVLVRLGNGDGTLSGGDPLGGQWGFTTGEGPGELVAADLDGDYRQDLVTANWYSHNVSRLLQRPPAPTISGFTPGSGPAGTSVTVTGTALASVTSVFFFEDVASPSVSVLSDTRLTVVVPSGATSGPIQVYTRGGFCTSAASFTVLPPAQPPTISGFIPASGMVGTSVTVTGTNLTGATAVTFNGVAASFSVLSATQLSATVPPGVTSGPIAVFTPGGSCTSTAGFTVLSAVEPPTISGFTPASGPVGTSVTVTGTNLTGATAVTFNGVAASFSEISATQFNATVPKGLTTGRIAVTTLGGAATSATDFTLLRSPCKVTLKLSGLTSGALRLGRGLTAKGAVASANLGAKVVKLTVQRKSGTRWVSVKTVSRTLSAGGAYSWWHKPALRGSYRIRATVARTATNLAAATTWRAFSVR